MDHLDELSEIIDSVLREGRYRLFTSSEDDEAAVFRIHLDTDFLQQVFVLAEHFGDTADCEDVAFSSHGQGALDTWEKRVYRNQFDPP